MDNQPNRKNWHLLADRFIWYDSTALSTIPETVSSEEIQQYLFTFHNDNISLDEINDLRARKQPTN